ncbi:MAG: hypothetical protein AB7S65_06625 [Sulfuricurvum sp.]
MKNLSRSTVVSLILLGSSIELGAADWLMLQGSEPETVAPQGMIVPNRNKTPKLWGFAQINYKNDYGSVATSGGKNTTPFSLLAPDLEDQSGFNLFRARLAVRGMADDDNMVNYFVMTDFGNNGVNHLANHDTGTYLTDASVTLKYVPFAKLRAGRFKYPGSEEGMQGVYFSPYIDFTTMTDQEMQERRLINATAPQTGSAAGGASSVHYTTTSVDNPIGAFRDTGAEIFDTIPLQDAWAFSYAYMYGNGTGISNSDTDTQGTHYGYLALEKNFGGGKGYYTNAMKFYVWGQEGKRKFVSNNTAPVEADRQRYGAGITYYNHGLRFEAEYMMAKGMIYVGAKDVDTNALSQDWELQFATGNENKANGGYVNLQYELIPNKFEVFGRYDFMNRLTNDVKGERDFKTTTLGASYRFKGPTRIDFNYLIRDAKAPGNASAQTILDHMGNRAEVQITYAF